MKKTLQNMQEILSLFPPEVRVYAQNVLEKLSSQAEKQALLDQLKPLADAYQKTESASVKHLHTALAEFSALKKDHLPALRKSLETEEQKQDFSRADTDLAA